MYLPTCSKSPLCFDTLGAALCRHNVIVDGVCSEFLDECNCSRSTLGGGGIPEYQVSVGWICTIVNGASISWLEKSALQKGT